MRLLNYYKIFLILFFTSITTCKAFTDPANDTVIEIPFEVSDYRLLFTKVTIGDEKYTALIDFGDFSQIQLSTDLIEKLGLETMDSDIVMSDINGNNYNLQKGVITNLTVSGVRLEDTEFFSAHGEIKAVSQQVGTDFDVVLGFGFFKNKPFTLDFINRKITFGNQKSGSRDEFDEFKLMTDYGYLITEIQLESHDKINLLFDTGSPNSTLSDKESWNGEDTKIEFQGFQFPAKKMKVLSRIGLSITGELMDITHIEPLGVQGIYGVNDMLDKVFVYDPEAKTLQVY